MISTQPKRLPTMSGADEMCAAGGGESELYRPRFPFDLGPYDVVGCCGETFIGEYLLLSSVDKALV